MIVPETYHVPHCATHAQTFFASEDKKAWNDTGERLRERQSRHGASITRAETTSRR